MGKLEKEVRSEIRRTRINSAIITALAVGGALTIAVLAPNVLGVLGQIHRSKSYQRKQNIKKSISRLIDRGYVANEKGVLCLTSKGERFATLMGEGNLVPKKPRRWDGKWRVLIFDIPERRKRIRDQVRHTLGAIGFYRLQDSVWVYPYDCEDFVTLLKVDFRIGKDLLYIVADKIENDLQLRRKFSLR